MAEAKQFTIKISSGSNPLGKELYLMTPSVFDEVGTRTFETREELGKTLMAHMEGTTQAGVDLVLKHIEQYGYTIFQAKLTQASAKHLAWNF
jgi:hypothetical protein